MSYFEFPHTRNYNGDLGYIIKKLDELTDRYNEFFTYNTIKFSDPINWDITKQYEVNIIVSDFNTNRSYVSKKPVPAGIDILNTDYWLMIGNFVVDLVLNSSSSNPIANKTVTVKFNEVSNELNNLNNKINNEAIVRQTNDNSIIRDISSINTQLTAEISARTSADAVLSSRIDSIESLPGGSTSLDAEVTDIRVGYDGTTYNTAGDAVRGQIGDIHDILSDIVETSQNLLPANTKVSTVNDVSCSYNNGKFTFSGTASGGGGRTVKTIDPITLPAGTYTISINTVTVEFYLETVSGNTIIATINTLTPITITLESETSVYLGFNTVNGRTYSGSEYIQIEKGSNATAWTEPSFTTAVDKFARDIALNRNILTPFYQTANDSGFKIYLANTRGYTVVTLLHQIVGAIKCDSWRIDGIAGTDKSRTDVTNMTSSGEIEMAIMLDGRPDYIGGRFHGDEETTSVKFYIDGLPKDPAGINMPINFNELIIVTTSDLFDPLDDSTKVAEHGKKYIFNNEGLTLEQYVNWVEDETISALYLSMLTGSKTVTRYGYTNKDFEPFELSAHYGNYSNINFICEYSDNYYLSMESVYYPVPTGSKYPSLRLTDNNADYNKAYFSGYTGEVNSGDFMESKTVFKFDNNV